MTGIPAYSTTASENVNSNTGINMDEGMAPAALNNGIRQIQTDMRLQWNDASWFLYGNGSKTVAHTYASSTSTTIATDVTTYYHAGRRIKAVGSGTGTIYGRISSSSYSAPNTTVNYTWDSGSLSNEALTIYASTMPVTGAPVSTAGVACTATNDDAAAGRVGEFISSTVSSASSVSLTTVTGKSITSISLTAGDWDVSASAWLVGGATTNLAYFTASISTTDNTNATTGTSARVQIGAQGTPFGTDTVQGFAVGPHRLSLSATTTVYLVETASFSVSTLSGFGTIRARRVR
jgi:hypothetical protein